MNFVLVFDVESIGLHGEGYAVGFVVVDGNGVELTSGCFACSPSAAAGADADRQWVDTNVPFIAANCTNPKEVRARFWVLWRDWAARNAIMVGDCAWPVEARFLSACIDDVGASAVHEAPYPLLDVSTLRTVARVAGVETDFPRENDELPVHNPVADARHSARQWREITARLDDKYKRC